MKSIGSSYPSCILTPAEKHYWATELEVSCIVWVVRKIRHMIEAVPEDLTPVAYTDHMFAPSTISVLFLSLRNSNILPAYLLVPGSLCNRL